MVPVIVVWVLAMVAGLIWPRWVVAVYSVAVVVLASVAQRPTGGEPLTWLPLVVFGATPWLLAAQRRRYLRRVTRAQGSDEVKRSRMQETGQSLANVHEMNQQLESAISRITDLYHVTKQTARAMRVEDLFVASLEIVPRLVAVQGLRLIDLSKPAEGPRILRATRAPDGRLNPAEASSLLAFEQAIVATPPQSGAAILTKAECQAHDWPPGLSQVAWAPLRSEDARIGILIADELPAERLGTFSVVANQLSLQLARIHFYQAIESMAVTDSLTGLYVRRYFLELSAEELRRSQHHRLPCTFLMADLDLFKSKNDTYGHLVGDVILRDVAQLMQSNLREVDLMARYGGEEFILLLIETGPEQAMVIAERLREIVESQSIRAYDETLHQTVSLGMATFPEDGSNLQELIDRTDEALYAAKRSGRNRVVRWSAATHAGQPSTAA